MRLVLFRQEDRQGLGLIDGESVVDLGAGAAGLPGDMTAFIEAGEAALKAAAALKDRCAERLPLDQVRLLAPFPRPVRNIFCVGKNYRAHAEEFHASGFDASARDAQPDVPVIFTKATTSVIGPHDPIPAHLDPTSSVDYEGELTVVIGKGGRGIRAQDAFEHVFGYTIINDVTARTLQHRHKQWFLGKSLDGFCPMGPAVVTRDEVPDVRALQLLTRVNGELRQDAPVADLIFDIPTLIATISLGTTLLPGDLIATGTAAGVGIGFDPPRYLKAGDEVAVTIEPIGTLTNPVA
jgi:2-keto-4-pentenoate hydratase/2-oxohepta-3-ene-1,7-dioic acid hydratase in catechol pathway